MYWRMMDSKSSSALRPRRGARSALTPDGQYIVVSCDDERNITGGLSTLPSATSAGGTVALLGGYSISVLRTSDMTVAAQAAVGPLFVGLQIVPTATGYTIYASGGGDQNHVAIVQGSHDAGVHIERLAYQSREFADLDFKRFRSNKHSRYFS